VGDTRAGLTAKSSINLRRLATQSAKVITSPPPPKKRVAEFGKLNDERTRTLQLMKSDRDILAGYGKDTEKALLKLPYLSSLATQLIM